MTHLSGQPGALCACFSSKLNMTSVFFVGEPDCCPKTGRARQPPLKRLLNVPERRTSVFTAAFDWVILDNDVYKFNSYYQTLDYFQSLGKEGIVASALAIENDMLIMGHKSSAKVHFHKYNPHDERFDLENRNCMKWRTKKYQHHPIQ